MQGSLGAAIYQPDVFVVLAEDKEFERERYQRLSINPVAFLQLSINISRPVEIDWNHSDDTKALLAAHPRQAHDFRLSRLSSQATQEGTAEESAEELEEQGRRKKERELEEEADELQLEGALD
jgi:hypothetical protein